MKTIWLLPLALPLMAAAPPRQPFSLTVPVPSDTFGGGNSFSGSPPAVPTRYQPAPLPDRDIGGPGPGDTGPAQPSLSPTVFSSREQFRGDGFSPHSTAQAEQERNVKPSVGFKLQVPLSPN